MSPSINRDQTHSCCLLNSEKVKRDVGNKVCSRNTIHKSQAFCSFIKKVYSQSHAQFGSRVSIPHCLTLASHTHSKSVNLGIYHGLYLWHANNVSISNQCRHGYLIN